MRRLLLLAALVPALAACGSGTVTGAVPETVIGTLPKAPTGSAAGKAVFDANGCGGCHTYKPAGSGGKVGPDLDNLASDAQKADHGTVEAYARQSILDPNAYVVPGFPKGVMPSFSGKIADAQLTALVGFLTKKS
jgi:mono/diheme cytochrome c family protein